MRATRTKPDDAGMPEMLTSQGSCLKEKKFEPQVRLATDGCPNGYYILFTLKWPFIDRHSVDQSRETETHPSIFPSPAQCLTPGGWPGPPRP